MPAQFKRFAITVVERERFSAVSFEYVVWWVHVQSNAAPGKHDRFSAEIQRIRGNGDVQKQKRQLYSSKKIKPMFQRSAQTLAKIALHGCSSILQTFGRPPPQHRLTTSASSCQIASKSPTCNRDQCWFWFGQHMVKGPCVRTNPRSPPLKGRMSKQIL